MRSQRRLPYVFQVWRWTFRVGSRYCKCPARVLYWFPSSQFCCIVLFWLLEFHSVLFVDNGGRLCGYSNGWVFSVGSRFASIQDWAESTAPVGGSARTCLSLLMRLPRIGSNSYVGVFLAYSRRVIRSF